MTLVPLRTEPTVVHGRPWRSFNAPISPVAPLAPVVPLAPVGPWAPRGPAMPLGPRRPRGPRGPRFAVDELTFWTTLTACVDPTDFTACTAAPPTPLSASSATTSDTIEIA